MYDVIIIGSGIAGLVNALKLGEFKLKVLLVTKGDLGESNSYLAQGGIVYSGDKYLVNDIWKASGNTSSKKTASFIKDFGPSILEEVLLEKCGTKFTHQGGKLLLTREAAHRIPRIIYQSDYTGTAIISSLVKYIKRFKNIKIWCHCTAIDLIMSSDRVAGVILLKNGKINKVMSKVVVLATGGISALYANTTNLDDVRGDGHAMALRARAVLNNMEFVQFHPTAFFEQKMGRRFLISETLRGEGALLKNWKGDRFMNKYHSDKELAPRDVVSRAIVREMAQAENKCVFLDITKLKRNYLKKRFPSVFEYCLNRGIDISKDYIPVVPAAHYTCGGIQVDLFGRTSIKGLYAVGEVASTGLHGANRLASTSLLEGLVFAYQAAVDIVKQIKDIDICPTKVRDFVLGKSDRSQILQDTMVMRETMWNYVGIFRNNLALRKAKKIINNLESQVFHRKVNKESIVLKNSITVAKFIIEASIKNDNSQGCFYKE